MGGCRLRSISENMTPGRTARSSRSTSTPGRAQAPRRALRSGRAPGPRAVGRSAGGSATSQRGDGVRPGRLPFSSWFLLDGRAAAMRAHPDAVAGPSRGWRARPPSSRHTAHASIRCTCGRAGTRGRPRSRDGWRWCPRPVPGSDRPSMALRRSGGRGAGEGRAPQLTPARWGLVAGFAPQTKSAAGRRPNGPTDGPATCEPDRTGPPPAPRAGRPRGTDFRRRRRRRGSGPPSRAACLDEVELVVAHEGRARSGPSSPSTKRGLEAPARAAPPRSSAHVPRWCERPESSTSRIVSVAAGGRGAAEGRGVSSRFRGVGPPRR